MILAVLATRPERLYPLKNKICNLKLNLVFYDQAIYPAKVFYRHYHFISLHRAYEFRLCAF